MFPDLHLDGTPLPVVHECVLLGVHLNDELTWDDHVQHMVSKASRSMSIMYRAKKFHFNTDTLLILYNWYIRTTLEYTAPTWHPGLTEAQHHRIERLQKRCFRIVLGAQYLTYENALQTLQACTLRERRESLTMRFGRSLLNSPQHRGLLPPTLGQVHGRNTRNRNNLPVIQCNTERYRCSTIPYIVRLLNGM